MKFKKIFKNEKKIQTKSETKRGVYNPTICLHTAHSGVVKRRMEHSLSKYGG